MIKGADLENRAILSGQTDPERLPDERAYRGRVKAAVEGPGLAERLASAKALMAPTGACRACFQGGRDAVVTLVSGAGEARPLADRLVLAGALRPAHDHGNDAAFSQGRDAAIRALAGEG